jgi:putative transposase
VDYVRRWSDRTEIAAKRFIGWLGVAASKYHDWRSRYGRVNEHNAWVPRDHWLTESEKQAIVNFHRQHPLEGYRRLTFMMLDGDVVAASPASVYRVLKAAGLLRRWNRRQSKKGTGFVQPLTPHAHWHTDVSFINVCGTFYHLCSLLDGYSRFIVDWELGQRMTECEIEILIQRAREQFPLARPRIISDNGPQFIARDFKEFIRVSGFTHVRTSPYYPQSNGKIERWHKSLKSECIRPGTPLSLDDTRRSVSRFVEHYNAVRLHSAIGYVAPRDKLEGRAEAIWAERDRKLEAARQQRKTARQAARAVTDTPLGGDDAARHRPEAPTDLADLSRDLTPVVQSTLTWAEDRAMLGSNPSADPGAKTEGRAIESVARPPQPGAQLSRPFGIGTKAINPRPEGATPPRQTRRPAGVTPMAETSISG